MFGVTILGNNSAVPAFDRHPTSQLLTTSGHNFLIDCGEGTQIQLIKYKIRRNRISHIFISHLHGDHYFGLIGLINSFALLGRQQDLTIVAPEPLQKIIEMQLSVADTRMGFPLHFLNISQPGHLITIDDIEISCFKTNHRIICYGFTFKELKKPRHIDPEAVKIYNVPVSSFNDLQMGKDYLDPDGNCIKNELLTTPGNKGKFYAYCADTCYDESLIDPIKNADMIYHETTYLDNFSEMAFQRFHSTTKQAGKLASLAGVKKLLIGHFSSRYYDLEEFEKETREIFPNTDLTLEGVCYLMP
ncbi:MAG TPA: ribonuclease Z [Niabella sp.]|nr:ribonuclease Z [Niabella sp.]HOZ96712.1 ribonuclease Z [Niabella sp.]HQW14420.1 ribonuclease Z [Niabella sp.]HQX19835.1 ribonuclease Z [Niabella sp.]HQX40706.1 ribonuclease Z [Niabella sp.]